MEQTSIGRGHAQPLALFVRCGIALAVNVYLIWLLNNGVFPTTSATFPLAREFQTASGILLALVVVFATRRRPQLVDPRLAAVGAAALDVAGSALLVALPASAAGVTAGLVLSAVGRSWNYYLIGVTLTLLGPGKQTFATVTGAVLVSTLVTSVVPAPGYAASSVLLAIGGLAGLALLFGPTCEGLDRLRSGQAVQDLAVANPQSFLSPSHQVYVLMFIFSMAFGFALSLNIVLYTPVTSSFELVAVAVVAAWFLLAPSRPSREDGLFYVSALLVVAGYLAVPLADLGVGQIANGLLYAGNRCFSILSWVVLAALCARNRSGALLVLACSNIATGAGTFAGADLGHLVNALLEVRPEASSLVVGAVVLALFAYVLVGLRGFSISTTIRGIVPAVPVSVPEAAASSHDGQLERACRRLAERGGLTAREEEVLALLARGHNSRHIQDALTLSYNTVKTHVKRIYRKLDVHSQQELIDLAIGSADEGEGSGRKRPDGA